ncbi:DUF3012 domain-containing protein [Microbulbifer sp. 2205BS26-8]|uniref:DUF3012 domain-containing protein n=1 Tax=Microbulbifer sp. 2205BS26-8 TaxID=3064386 RepID=UPI00273E46F6|nr:DUF3012 domain-containing protein [Microbulbifer sp. 2205BS26-8]MDP5208741.1 DUF3012 domain-containing protein [Microbulbifer sp. 2205BS26-8]
MKNVIVLLSVVAAVFVLSACEPKRGSDAWCEKMNKVPKGQWTLDDGRDYTKYCVFKQKPEEE